MSEVGASLVDEKLFLKIVPKTKVCSKNCNKTLLVLLLNQPNSA